CSTLHPPTTEKEQHTMKLSVLSACTALLALPGITHAQSLADILEPKAGRTWFVSEKGDNKAEGTKAAPLKNLDKALGKAAAGDTIAGAEGTYRGTFDVGLWEIDKDVKLYGGFSADFSARNPVKHATLLQPDASRFDKSGVKPMIYLKD